MHVDDAIRSRRTIKQFDGTPVDDATVRELIALAMWAPNHKRTEPWRFSVVTQRQLPLLAAAAEAALQSLAKPPVDASLRAKQAKIRELLMGAGAVVVVSYVRSPDDACRDREDFAATCAAIQNLLLGATARGLGSLWSTSKALIGQPMRAFWALPDDEEPVGALVLGHSALGMPAVRHHSNDELTRWR
jgi:F420 biosynthesis protein FbiB-like protein